MLPYLYTQAVYKSSHECNREVSKSEFNAIFSLFGLSICSRVHSLRAVCACLKSGFTRFCRLDFERHYEGACLRKKAEYNRLKHFLGKFTIFDKNLNITLRDFVINFALFTFSHCMLYSTFHVVKLMQKVFTM